MIEGLKVTVAGAELRTLCTQRAEHHRQRAKVYATQEAQMEANEIEAMHYSNGDPKRVLKDNRRMAATVEEGTAHKLVTCKCGRTMPNSEDRGDSRKDGISFPLQSSPDRSIHQINASAHGANRTP